MSNKITASVVESSLQCPYKAHLQLFGETGEPHEYDVMRREAREQVRASATVKLLGRHTEHDVPQGLPLSIELLKREVPLILDTVLEDDNVCVRFDGLLRVNGPSKLGSFHYAPVLFHEGARVGPEARMVLAVLAELLGSVQGTVPAIGIVFHGPACQERKVKLTTLSKPGRRLVRELHESRAGPAPRLVLNDHCQACQFRKRCHAEASAKDDLSLLRAMGTAEVAKYAKRGIFTVAQLACTFRPSKRTAKPENRKPIHSHALQALAVRERKTHILGRPVLPDSPTRLYLDIEGDPERGFCYLLGVVVRAGEKEERHSFWIDTPAEETLLLDRFLDLVAKHPDAWVYTYGSYEASFLRRVGKITGREEAITRVLTRTFNALSTVYLHVHFPLHSNGLKDIAGHLGFRWTDPEASGLGSIVWRRRWEQNRESAFKDRLLTYNLEDCDALRKVTEFLYQTCPQPQASGAPQEPSPDHAVTRVEEMKPVSSRGEWCKVTFAIPDFEFANERAYFDYQRDRVYIRTSKTHRKRHNRQRRHKLKKNLTPNRTAAITSPACPTCAGTELTRAEDGRLARVFYDLRIARGAVRRCVTRCTTSWHSCARCHKWFLPPDYLRLEMHGHGLKSWAMYKHVAHRTTFAAIADEIGDCFGLPITVPEVHAFKGSLARRYEPTYRALLAKIVGGSLIHADETEVHLKGEGKGYIWVFTNLEEVVFMYRKSREGGFLAELLKGFRGVLVSDFYAAYDALDCPQQKCLVHLMRDFNNDIQSSPWDEELKGLASSFGRLLRDLVSTVDTHGLKARHLGRHEKDVTRFFDSVEGTEYRSQVAESYRERLVRNRAKLFTFIRHDGIPWNNNNAEHAVKQFAHYREIADGQFLEKGLSDYLKLLSIRLTCKYKGLSFLKFLLSRQTEIDVFASQGAKKESGPAFELYPEGVLPSRPSRRQTWMRMQGKGESPSSKLPS